MITGARSQGDLHISYLEALDDEYRALRDLPAHNPLRAAYRAARCRHAAVTAGSEEEEPQAPTEPDRAESAFRRDLLRRLHEAKLSALCFSGGGIRSATFGLGILQGLAVHSLDEGERDRPRLLGEFDYLSTVSGGGYLGSWFSAWAAREAASGAPSGGTASVIRQLARNPDTGFDPEPPAVRHLRGYSNYLIPRLGLFSGDTWAVIGTVVRNMFLNWLVLVPLVALVLLVPEGALAMLQLAPAPGVQWAVLVAGFACGALATAYIGFDLPSAGNARGTYARYVALCLAPLVLSAVLLNTFWAWLEPGRQDMAQWNMVGLGRQNLAWWHLAAFGAAMYAGGMFGGIRAAMKWFDRPPPKTGFVATAAAIVTGGLGGLVMYGFILFVVPASGTTDPRLYVSLAFPLVVAVFLFAGALLVGFTSYITEDKDREWWARSGGILLGIALAWVVFAGVVLYSDAIIDRLTWTLSSSIGLLTGWVTARLSSSADTASGPREATARATRRPTVAVAKDLGARLALPVFLFMLALVLARANAALLQVVPGTPVLACLALGALYLAIGVGTSYFVNVNSFSLHAMYKLRLVRAYLGASNPHRDKKAHPFTGFDEFDDVEMHTLSADRPLHVVNMALNLVGGKNLAWQQRKAGSFTSTRLHTGSCRVGYRPSNQYGGRYPRRWPLTWLRQSTHKAAVSLGTAMTISGAAASPNMGYNSSPLLTVVMTLFNARLGWWLGNPAVPGGYWRYPGPLFGVRPFLDEALGLTDDSNRWVYLSDGGHFDNLGLYEMVMRRCNLILVCDSSADPKFGFQDLGNAVRKVRVDLGVSIEFQGAMPERYNPDARGEPGIHCAIGHIRYADDVPDGTLIYIKASLTGDEPPDVRHYASQNRDFPHQTTTDQFFDEAQFESYRRLGLHIIERIGEQGGETSPPARTFDLAEFEARAKRYCEGVRRAPPVDTL
jgi:hypothetical protein